MDGNRGANNALCHRTASQIFSYFPAFLIHTTPDAPALSHPGSWASGTVAISLSAISSSGVYSGGNGGGTGLRALAANSSGNFSRKLCLGKAQASPNAPI